MATKKKTNSKKPSVKKKKKVKNENPEVFEVEKQGKEKEIFAPILKEEDKPLTKEEKKSQNKALLGVLVVMGCLILMFAGFYAVKYYIPTIQYKGVNFNMVREGQLIFYQTSLPVLYNNKTIPYNFYLTTDPRKAEKIPFEATGINIKKLMVVNLSSELSCKGDGVVAGARLTKLYNVIGTKVIQDKNATCDESSRYNYISLVPGNETKVVSYGKNNDCFRIEVKDCEVIAGAEKFMLETFAKLHEEESKTVWVVN